ncbi:hypothetical protein MVEN_01738300 [Mycena venus]|uniref:Uncharacterized protein n=1 Tax=Mycena venus TaxID=2733690 RepID=A0A8H6XM05_9AGAR|nr:hypothetical protein MVEN_01738300 [Mycena venus]
MKFSFATLVTLGALVFPGTVAQLTANQIVAAINLVTNISQNSNDVLTPLSTSTAGDQVQVTSQTLVNNINMIISNIAADVTAIEATLPFPPEVPGGAIVAALDNFVAVHQAFLATVTGKHSIFAQFQVTAPIAAILRSLEATIDSLGSALINVILDEVDAISANQAKLDVAVGNTLTTYEETCVPSPLYPIVLPVCSGGYSYIPTYWLAEIFHLFLRF